MAVPTSPANLTDFILSHHLGDWASIVGLPLTIAGFLYMLIQISKSKSISKRTSEAVNKVREELARRKNAGDITNAIEALRELQHLQRETSSSALPDRYGRAARSLMTIRGQNIFTEEQKAQLQQAITEFGEAERNIKKLCYGGSIGPKVLANYDTMISRHMDSLTVILESIKETRDEQEKEGP